MLVDILPLSVSADKVGVTLLHFYFEIRLIFNIFMLIDNQKFLKVVENLFEQETHM